MSESVKAIVLTLPGCVWKGALSLRGCWEKGGWFLRLDCRTLFRVLLSLKVKKEPEANIKNK